MKKWTKCIALMGILAICLSMLAGCQVGRNYSEEMMGNKDGLPSFKKDQKIEVPYTGEAKDEIIDTDDPVLAGLCDSEGNLTDGSGKVDLSNLGGSSDNNSNNNNNNNDSSNNDNQNEDDKSDADNNGGDDEEEEEDPLDALITDNSGTKIRVLSQNIRKNDSNDIKDGLGGAVRMYRFKTLVDTYDPDVFGTQEVDSFWVDAFTKMFSSKYTMSYQYRGALKGSDEACAILWKTSKYNLLDKGQFWLSETPDKANPPGFGLYYPRIAHWVKLEDKTTGDKILFFSTHFDFPRSEKHPNGYLKEDLVYLRGLFADVCEKHPDAYPVIVGDFNMSYGSESFEVINDGKDMVDLREIAQNMKADGHCSIGDIRKGTSGAFEFDDGNNIIDFIFVQPRANQAVDYYTFLYDRLDSEDYNIDVGPVSDHFAVMAEIRINTKLSYKDYYGGDAK